MNSRCFQSDGIFKLLFLYLTVISNINWWKTGWVENTLFCLMFFLVSSFVIFLIEPSSIYMCIVLLYFAKMLGFPTIGLCKDCNLLKAISWLFGSTVYMHCFYSRDTLSFLSTILETAPNTSSIFLYFWYTSCKTEQPLQDLVLQAKSEESWKYIRKYIRKLFRKNPKIKGVSQS